MKERGEFFFVSLLLSNFKLVGSFFLVGAGKLSNLKVLLFVWGCRDAFALALQVQNIH